MADGRDMTERTKGSELRGTTDWGSNIDLTVGQQRFLDIRRQSIKKLSGKVQTPKRNFVGEKWDQDGISRKEFIRS
jgi:hypothetical protein